MQRALEIAREIGDRDLEAWALTQLAQVEEDLRRYEEAERHYTSAMEMRREQSSPRMVDELHGLARILIRHDRQDEARTHFEEIVGLSEETEMRGAKAVAHGALALIAGADPEPARALLAEGKLSIAAKMETYFLLWQAGQDKADLDEAHRLLQHLCEGSPEEHRTSMVENVPLHSEIAAAWQAENA